MSSAQLTSAESPWQVATLSGKLKSYIARLGSVWVEGELTQWNISRGTAYAKLKDLNEDVTVSLTIWGSSLTRLTEKFAQGDRVLAQIKPDFWPRAGTLTMVVSEIRHAGLGDLLAQIEQLRQTLHAEGLFAANRKKKLPFLPSLIGLITGKDSDAEKDVLRNAELRWPQVHFRVHHAAVQGEYAVREITAAIQELDADPEVEVIIVARGGGDFQQLLAFSDETLVRAAATCATPLVSAIGHEADNPLLDLVADLRASTPTDAAKRVVPDVAEEFARIREIRSRLLRQVTALVKHEILRIDSLRTRPVLANPEHILNERVGDLARLIAEGVYLANRRINKEKSNLGIQRSRLDALSPQRTLERGYALVRRADKTLVRKIADAPAGTDLKIRVSLGELDAVVR